MPSLHPHDKSLLGTTGLVLLGALAYAAGAGGFAPTLGIGLLLLAISAAVAVVSQAGAASRVLLPALGMGMVGLLIHAARGVTEAHFAVFAFLAVTTVYRHWLPVLSATVAIALHHVGFNYFQQWGWGPICFTEPGLARVLEHAAYVVAEAGALVALAQRARRGARASEELVEIAESMVAPDGSIRFDAAHRACQSEAARLLQQTLRRMEAAIGDVHASTAAITTASAEIASGNQDLSQRTEQSAGELQRTAGAVAQFASSVSQTADASRTANQLASSASDVAQRGGAVVSQVIATMDDIDAASKKISDIIGVIDGIAFQTNILALNAAVEAARAGEQGRGFAVVAGEVRLLAQRSADAAKEIKALIGTSVDRVENGARLVQDAGRTMDEIVASVRRVTDIIGEITAASTEQSGGLGQIKTAVAQLDQMTQQNAALVEESAAAAGSLQQQALQLTRAVGTFKLGDAAGAAPAHAGAIPAARSAADASGTKWDTF
jgi:methyl-accepting chemotaxis protein